MSDICSKCGFDMDAQFEARARLIDKLEAYEKGCANLESEIAHLRQENAELKSRLKESDWLIMNSGNAAWRLGYQESRDWLKRRDQWLKGTTPPNPKSTQDPSTTIAYGLYPSSARPVNPQIK